MSKPLLNAIRPLTAVAVSALALAINPAQAQLAVHVNFDYTVFNRTDLVGPAGGSGQTWNQTMDGTHGGPGFSKTNVLDSAGNPTAIDWSLSRSDAGALFRWVGSDSATLSMLQHGIFTNSGLTHTLTITELDPAKKYDLYITGYQTGFGNQVSHTTTRPTTTPSPQVLTNTGQSANWVLNDTYVVFEDMEPDGTGTLTVNAVKTSAYGFWSGFQLIEVNSGTDTSPPTPNPMTWSTAPTAASASSITMTATTANDASGVEYFFDETSGNPGSSDSVWQDSPTYIDTGLTASTAYTYTVRARDKSPAQNVTGISSPASATITLGPTADVVWNVNFDSSVTNRTDLVGPAGGSGQTWNQTMIGTHGTTGFSNTNLLDSAGNTTTLDWALSRSDAGGLFTWNGSDSATLSMLRHGIFTNTGVTHTLSLTSLDPTKKYDLYITGYQTGFGNTVSHTTTFPTTTPIPQVLSNSGESASWVLNDNYIVFEDMIPNGSGTLTVDAVKSSAYGFWSGFQLVQTDPTADMLTFGLPGNPAVINGTNITLTMPYGSSVTNLAPTYTLWSGATCVPVSGTARNFSTPQTYTVTSSNSLVTKNYTATVVIAPPPPEFTLIAPATWDGRQTITVTPNITNLALLQATGGTNFNYQWSVNGLAVSYQITPGVMTLTYSQGSGPLLVTLTMDNGTAGVTESATINVQVQEPTNDPWVERTPVANEKPVAGQFFARNPDTNSGTIFYRGTQSGTPDTVYLKVFKTPSGGSEILETTHRQSLVSGAYSFTAPIAAGLFTYRVTYGTTTGGVDTDVATVTDLVCGDAYIIEGQSNAVSLWALPSELTTDPFVRTYANSSWGLANRSGGDYRIGYWGMKLALDLRSTHNMPICIINGAVGGTRIDEHQANPANHTIGGSLYSIYANLLNRVIGAKLNHGIRGVFWHQGESDSSNFGPIADYDYTAYQQNFLNMSISWKQDFPNLQRYVIFQVMPFPCSIGPTGDQLREVQRNLPILYSKMSVLNTLGLTGYDGCHFTETGYNNIANRMLPVVSRDFYGVTSGGPVTPPNLKRAYFTSSARTAIALEFDQAMSWSGFSTPNLYVDDIGGRVTSGSAVGNIVTLQLNSAAAATAKLDYLKDTAWSYTEPTSTLLYGANAIPAHTFADVSIGAASLYQTWAATNAGGQTSSEDFDNDGVENGIEYFMGQTGSSFTATPGLDGANTITWTMDADFAGTYEVQTSPDLGIWTNVVPRPTPSGGNLSYMLPNDLGKRFVRLLVTPTP